jgi:hypothetical protein
MTTPHGHKIKPGTIAVGDVSLFVEVVGKDIRWCSRTEGLRQICGRCPRSAVRGPIHPVFYDHRCNGRSDGPPVSSMT